MPLALVVLPSRGSSLARGPKASTAGPSALLERFPNRLRRSVHVVSWGSLISFCSDSRRNRRWNSRGPSSSTTLAEGTPHPGAAVATGPSVPPRASG
eukprot:10113970-Alexandrium_andersonii.AAC.1